MKKRLLFSVALLLFVAVLVVPVLSVESVVTKGTSIPNPSTTLDSPDELYAAFSKYFKYVYGVLLGIAIIWFIISGFQYLTAGGEPEKIKAARTNILHSLVGIAIMIGAGIVISLVSEFLGVTTPTSDIIPFLTPQAPN